MVTAKVTLPVAAAPPAAAAVRLAIEAATAAVIIARPMAAAGLQLLTTFRP